MVDMPSNQTKPKPSKGEYPKSYLSGRLYLAATIRYSDDATQMYT